MSDIQTLYASRRDAERDALPEHSVVELTAAANGLEGAAIPAGSIGTIVAILAGGDAYDVEFEEPSDVATVEAASLRAAPAPLDE